MLGGARSYLRPLTLKLELDLDAAETGGMWNYCHESALFVCSRDTEN